MSSTDDAVYLNDSVDMYLARVNSYEFDFCEKIYKIAEYALEHKTEEILEPISVIDSGMLLQKKVITTYNFNSAFIYTIDFHREIIGFRIKIPSIRIINGLNNTEKEFTYLRPYHTDKDKKQMKIIFKQTKYLSSMIRNRNARESAFSLIIGEDRFKIPVDGVYSFMTNASIVSEHDIKNQYCMSVSNKILIKVFFR